MTILLCQWFYGCLGGSLFSEGEENPKKDIATFKKMHFQFSWISDDVLSVILQKKNSSFLGGCKPNQTQSPYILILGLSANEDFKQMSQIIVNMVLRRLSSSEISIYVLSLSLLLLCS